MAQIFISYAREDEAHVRDLHARLHALGFNLWMDKVDLKVGQRWRQEIPRQLRASALVLVCFSRAAVEKVGFIRREFNLVLDILQEMPDDLIHTLPVLLEPCEVPEQFEEFNWCYLYEEDGFDRLVEGIRFGLTQRGLEVPTAEQVLKPSFTNSIGMAFVLIPAGEFFMGSPASDRNAYGNEKPSHLVMISQPFYLGRYPVTQGQWETIRKINQSRFTGNPLLPVDNVTYEESRQFLQRLNEREGVTHYRLPTEAQWEYACRADTETPRYQHDVDEIAWYKANSNRQTQPVGQKLPNVWGLHDMLGNVCEWCHDRMQPYKAGMVSDPMGTDGYAYPVVRGGCWLSSRRNVRAAYRLKGTPGFRPGVLGFRCAMSVANE